MISVALVRLADNILPEDSTKTLNSFCSPADLPAAWDNRKSVGPKNKLSSSGCDTMTIGRFERRSEAGMSAGLVGTMYAMKR